MKKQEQGEDVHDTLRKIKNDKLRIRLKAAKLIDKDEDLSSGVSHTSEGLVGLHDFKENEKRKGGT